MPKGKKEGREKTTVYIDLDLKSFMQHRCIDLKISLSDYLNNLIERDQKGGDKIFRPAKEAYQVG